MIHEVGHSELSFGAGGGARRFPRQEPLHRHFVHGFVPGAEPFGDSGSDEVMPAGTAVPPSASVAAEQPDPTAEFAGALNAHACHRLSTASQ